MATTLSSTQPKITCHDCVHRASGAFQDFSPRELSLMCSIKASHEVAWSGEIIVREGDADCRIGTLYSGLAIKYRHLATGKRQIVSILMPGDLISMECLYSDHAQHTVEAVTDVTYCLFELERLHGMLAVPEMAARVCSRLARQQQQAEERLTTLGACAAPVRVASLIVELHDQLRRRGMAGTCSFTMPLTTQQFADAVGLTSVHVSRVLGKLRADGVITIEGRRCQVEDAERLRSLAGSSRTSDALPPLF